MELKIQEGSPSFNLTEKNIIIALKFNCCVKVNFIQINTL